MAKNIIKNIPLQSIDSSTFTGNYQVLSAGLPQACFLVRIVNNSDRDITISYDGSNDHDFIAQKTTLQLPIQANSQPASFVANIRQGTPLYVKGTAGGTGLVYLAGYYQPAS